MKKGQQFITGISPANALSTALDLSSRRNTSSWLIMEVEIVKMKVEKKKDKKKETPIIAVAAEPEKVAASSPSQSSDIAARMAYLAQKASGGVGAAQLAAIAMNTRSPSMTGKTHEPTTIEPVAMAASSPAVPVAQPAVQTHQLHNHPVADTSMHYQQQKQQQQQHPISSNSASANIGMYALAVQPGQESKSYYNPNPSQSNPYPQPQPQPMYQQPQPQYPYHQPVAGDQSQLLSSIQALHSKIDHISYTLSSASTSLSYPNQRFSSNGNSHNSSNSIKIKAEDLVEAAKSLVDDYQKALDDCNKNSSRDQILKLEEKIESLQVSYLISRAVDQIASLQ
jgi:hypothetical protein